MLINQTVHHPVNPLAFAYPRRRAALPATTDGEHVPMMMT